MNCPKCHLPVEDDTFFCEHCGVPLNDNSTSQSIDDTTDMEKTMVIPVAKSNVAYSSEPERASVSNPVAKKNIPTKNTPKKNAKKSEVLKLKFMFTAVSFLITLVIGLGICALVIFTDDSPEAQTTASSQSGQNGDQAQSEGAQSLEEPTRIVEGSSECEKESVSIDIDTEFDFAFDCSLGSLQLSYKDHSGDEFGYTCQVPTSFEQVYTNDIETRYRATDNTAYVDVGAFENVDELSRGEIKSVIKDQLDGEILSEESGDGWFIMTTKKDDIVYYIKCFVGDYVKYLEFVNPAEYSDVYNVFIEDMEPLFQSME